MTTKEKIDQALGIAPGQSIDEFLDQLTVDCPNAISAAMSNIDSTVKNNIQDVDKKLSSIQNGTVPSSLAVDDINTSLVEINDLICVSKKIFTHCYNNIISSDLLDSELISATAKLLESIHISITEFIDLYKERIRYFDKIKMMQLQQEHRKELMELKHKHDLELIQARNSDKTNEIDAENLVSYSQESIIKMMKQIDNEQ